MTDSKRGTKNSMGWNDEQGKFAMDYVRIVSLFHFEDQKVVLACVSFLELCGLSSQRVKTETEVAKILLKNRNLCENSGRSPTEISSQISKELIYFDSGSNLVSELEGSILSNSAQNSISEEKEREKFALLSDFCRGFGVPNPGGLLKRLAERGDWFTFLSEAESQRFEPEQVLNIVNSCFKDKDLSQHLEFSLKKAIKMRGNDEKNEGNEGRMEEITGDKMKLLISARRIGIPSKRLLISAYKSERSVLCLLSASILEESEQNSLLDCAYLWLFITVFGDNSVENNQEKSQKYGEKSIEWMESMNQNWSVKELNGKWRGFDEKEWEKMVIECMQKEGESLLKLHRCLLLFDYQNPFLLFVEFWISFRNCRWSVCESRMRECKSSLEEDERIFHLGDRDFNRNLMAKLLDHLIESIDTFYEMEYLLNYIQLSYLSSQIQLDRKKSAFNALRRNDIQKELGKNLLKEPKEIIKQLMESGKVDQARIYARENGLVSNELTMEEARRLVEEASSKSNWNDDNERILLWNRVNSLLIERKGESTSVGNFFLNYARNSSPIIRSEKIFLLSLAQNWFVEKKETIPFSPISGVKRQASLTWDSAFENVSARGNVSEDLLNQIENEIIFLSTEMEQSLSNSQDSEQKKRVLDTIVGRFLESGNLSRAEKICSQYSYESLDIKIIKMILGIIEGNESIEKLPSDMSFIVKHNMPMVRFSNNLASNNQSGFSLGSSHFTKTEVLDALKLGTSVGRSSAEKIVINYKVSNALSLPYKVTVTKDPYEVLQLLFLSGRELYGVAKSFINSNQLEISKVASIVAESFYKSVIEQSMTSSSEIEISSDSEFSELAALSKSPKDVAVKLINLFCGHETVDLCLPTGELPSLTMVGEVEVLIKAYLCFSLSCNIIGMNLVLSLVRNRAQDYADKDEFPLLFRLLTGLKCYNKLQYIFAILIRYDRFELLLQKRNLDESSILALRVALQTHLQLNHSHDYEKLQMMFLRFHMHREIGEIIERMAFTKQNSIRGKLNQAALQTLSEVMQSFLDAANSYLKDKCFSYSNRCLAAAELVGLQISSPDTRLLNLTESEVAQLLGFKSSFKEALIIARAYQRMEPSDWTGIIWQQCVQNNFDFLEEYLCTFAPSDELFQEVSKKYRADPQRASHTKIFKKFLKYVNDKVLRYHIAMECDLDEVAQEIIQKVPSIKMALTLLPKSQISSHASIRASTIEI
eukprot:TRINITY_DN2217_c0_g3_i1.p1 TRINITY_DN2217_c0_g3~~TRINITY_DN2217_c0_g3_i1.p1  ORF type:complete len:1358 (-),score=501.49 TRINITY_DN2217_c0_g3_i1:43-3693(-)